MTIHQPQQENFSKPKLTPSKYHSLTYHSKRPRAPFGKNRHSNQIEVQSKVRGKLRQNPSWSERL